jgi:hypothetical protein
MMSLYAPIATNIVIAIVIATAIKIEDTASPNDIFLFTGNHPL